LLTKDTDTPLPGVVGASASPKLLAGVLSHACTRVVMSTTTYARELLALKLATVLPVVGSLVPLIVLSFHALVTWRVRSPRPWHERASRSRYRGRLLAEFPAARDQLIEHPLH
jgi:hypothetical protein